MGLQPTLTEDPNPKNFQLRKRCAKKDPCAKKVWELLENPMLQCVEVHIKDVQKAFETSLLQMSGTGTGGDFMLNSSVFEASLAERRFMGIDIVVSKIWMSVSDLYPPLPGGRGDMTT